MHNNSLESLKGAEFCSILGKEPRFCQGAGGNYSWKSGDSLFVKASGMWLADAQEKNIFVELNRKQYLDDLFSHDFDIDLGKYAKNGLKPSIETSMHALLPHRYVIHLHPVEVLAVLIQKNWRSIIEENFSDKLSGYSLINYYKPGKDLAKAVYLAHQNQPSANVFFLKNHGIIIADNNFESFQKLTLDTLDIFSNKFGNHPNTYLFDLTRSKFPHYLEFRHPTISKLISKKIFQITLERNWRLYPDHLVFMGMEALFLPDNDAHKLFSNHQGNLPTIFFQATKGCYIHEQYTQAQLAQLKCYLDVLTNIADYSNIESLSESDSLAILNWDAERYRLSLQK